MKKLSLISFILLFCFFMPQKKTRVVFFGDSITELGVRPGGYVRRIDSICNLENKSDQFEFIGAGISGNKIYDLYLRMDDDVLNKNPDVVVIYIGVNDIWHKKLQGTGTDPDRFEKFYNAILKKLRDRNIKAILCTPATIGEKKGFINQQDGDLNYYSNIIRSIAAKNNLPLIDLRKLFVDYDANNNPDDKDRGVLTTDGVHLNPTGNQLVAEQIWQILRSGN